MMVIFTGVIMMAAKHLDFTIENIAMILFAMILIYLELKRSLGLKNLNKKVKRIKGIQEQQRIQSP